MRKSYIKDLFFVELFVLKESVAVNTLWICVIIDKIII